MSFKNPDNLSDDGENIGFAHYQVLFAVYGKFAAGILTVYDLVAFLDCHRLVLFAGPYRNDYSLLWFSLAESGIMIPDAVFVSASRGSTNTLSANGLMLTFAIFKYIFG